jgi:tRNA pseudouridine55 synthase
MTSSEVVQKIRKVLEVGIRQRNGVHSKLKVGHGGTLDPLAEGVLVIGVGDCTKQLGISKSSLQSSTHFKFNTGGLLAGPKKYIAQGRFGSATDTLDCTGSVTASAPFSHITPQQLDDALHNFRGDYSQTPPMYSALKRNGKKLYELAREGIEVERQPRPGQNQHHQSSPNPTQLINLNLTSFFVISDGV